MTEFKHFKKGRLVDPSKVFDIKGKAGKIKHPKTKNVYTVYLDKEDQWRLKDLPTPEEHVFESAVKSFVEILTEANNIVKYPTNYHQANKPIQTGEFLNMIKKEVPTELFVKVKKSVDQADPKVAWVGYLYDKNRQAIFISNKWKRTGGSVQYGETQITL